MSAIRALLDGFKAAGISSTAVAMSNSEWDDVLAATEYAAHLMGPCVETLTLARFRQIVTRELQREGFMP